MNLFNRIILVVLLLALAAGAIAIAVLAWTAPNNSIDGLRDAVQWLDDNNQDFEKSLLTAGAIVLALLCLSLIAFELKPRYGPDVRVTDLQAGNAVLSTASVGQRVEEAVREVEHVSDVKAFVRARRKGVEVFLDLHVDPDANLAEVTNEACAAAQEMLTERVHVNVVTPPRARLHYRELRVGSARTTPTIGQPLLSTAAPVSPSDPPMTEAPKETTMPPTEKAPEATAVEAGIETEAEKKDE